jgi:putative spermidine/putrescine transport system permease protein
MLAMFLALPLASLLPAIFVSESNVLHRLWADALVVNAIVNSLLLGTGAASISVAFGTLLARAVARLTARRRQLMLTLLGVPLTFSGLVIAYGFILAFGRSGFVTLSLATLGFDPSTVGAWIYTPLGLAFAYAYYLIPRVALMMVPLFINLDRAPFFAALTLGARPVRAWFDTDFRELVPALLSMWCMIAAIAIGTYGTALALSGTQINILPLLIYLKISDGGSDFEFASLLSLILLALCVCVLALGQLANRYRTVRKNHG